MKTYLVTGGAGFIGSNLCDKLLADGHRVICFESFDMHHNSSMKWRNIQHNFKNPRFKVISGNILDTKSLEESFNGWNIDAVIHLAAVAGVRPSVQDPSLHSDINFTGTVNILECCRKHDINKLVYISSSSVYGNNPLVPSSEMHQTDKPLCPYAATKKASELMCYTYHYLYNMDIACLRPFTVYGPRQRTEMAIPLFTRLIWDGKTINVNNGDTVFRDFTYVGDIVNGIVGALGVEHGYEIYNIGSGMTTQLSQMVSILEASLGKKALIKHTNLGSGEATITHADISKAQRMFGYKVEHNIVSGIDKYVEWFIREGQYAI